MRVLFPYTRAHPRALAALEQFGGPHVEYVGVLGDPLAYWNAICERWAGREALAVIEHDVEIHDGVIPGFLECKEPWCSHAYEMGEPGRWANRHIGCTRYSADAQKIAPIEAVAAVPHSCTRCGGGPCWAHIDSKIAEALESGGVSVHEHRPPVVHWNRAIRRED